MKAQPQWEVEGRDWPNRDASQFVAAAGMRWHFQILGEGPLLMLVHGTGAATHSWRDLAPLLARHFRVLAMDLPGHGFTSAPAQGHYSLPHMATWLAALLDELNVTPSMIVGHSAGAAIAIRMALDGVIAPQKIVSLNGALLPFPGAAAVAFPILARLLFLNPCAVPFLAWRASDPLAVARLIEGTGSHLDLRGLDLYRRLFATRRHVAAAVGMMANWNLLALKRDLGGLCTPLTLVAADGDRAVPARDSKTVADMIPAARFVPIKGYGHLAHEEAPQLFADLIVAETVPA